jgi:hypothetical protein
MSVLYVAIHRTQIVTASRAPRAGRAGDLAVFNGNHGYSFHYLHSNGDINAAVAGHKSDECLYCQICWKYEWGSYTQRLDALAVLNRLL